MKKYIIYGAGVMGRALASYATKTNMPIECIADRDSGKWNRELEGIKVVSPDSAFKNIDGYDVIIAVSHKYVDEVRNSLIGYGFVLDNILLYTDVIKYSGNGSDMDFGVASGYIPHEAGKKLLKNAGKDKILIDKNTGECELAVNQENMKYFAEIYDGIRKINKKYKYTRNITCNNRFNYSLEGIDVYSYATEWPPEMYRSMCLFYLDFMSECNKENLTVDKLSYRDVIFFKGAFIYENLMNIRKGGASIELIERFIEKYITVMLLMRENRYDRAFWFVNMDWSDMSIKDVYGYLSREAINEYYLMLEKISVMYMKDDLNEIFIALKAYVRDMSLKSRDVYQWDSYQYSSYGSLNEPNNWSKKQKLVVDMIKSTDARTMIDLAGNMGWYCVAVKDYMKHTIVADIDYNSIDFVYDFIRKHDIKNVYPIHINMIAPPLDTYKNLPIGITGIEPWTKNAISRYRSDIVVALAVVHHLVFSQQLSFDEIVDQLCLYTNRWLIVEFVNRDDSFVVDAIDNNSQFDWYNKENFVLSLERRCRIISEGKTTETRRVYLCEMKKSR